MNATNDILRGELERHFELDDMKRLSAELLGYDPEQVGGTTGKGAFARALVERCAGEHGLEALADAIAISRRTATNGLRKIFDPSVFPELQEGTDVSGYRIRRKLGEGGVGVVYLAEREGGARVALKVVRPLYARDRSAVRRFMTVSRALGQLALEGLARTLEVGELPDGRPWVASEYVDGQTLATRLSKLGPVHVNEARGILRSVLEALDALHSRGLVHGDVKAENVFVARRQEEGQTRTYGVLVDPGVDRLLARGALDARTTGMLPVFGTAKAIAPELARGGTLEPSCDIYAVGALLYETLTGKPPFAGDSAIDVVAKHLTEEPELPSTRAPKGFVAKELDELVLRALSKDPLDRPGSARELLQAFEAAGRASRLPPKPGASLDEKAFAAAREALLAKPTEDEHATAIELLAGPPGAWQEASAALLEASGRADDVAAKKALLFRVARIEENERDDFDAAKAAYEKVLELDADDEIARGGLEELARQQGRADALVELLLEKTERLQASAERAAVLREIAELYETKLGSTDDAFVALTQALCDDPTDERTVREIERLADAPARWTEALEAATAAVADDSIDPTVRKALYLRMGRWYGERLGRPDFALSCFGQVLTLDPGNEEAYDATAELYRRTDAWPDLVALLLRRAEGASHAGRARDLRVEAARVVHDRLSDAERSSQLYRAVLQDDPAHPTALDGLEALSLERKDHATLADVLERRAETERGEARARTLVRLGELFEDEVGDLGKAIERYEAAHALDASSLPALKGLERTYARAERVAELAIVLEKELALLATPRQRIVVLERLGAIQEEEFLDAAKAAEAFERIVEVDPDHEVANTALVRLYRRLGRFDELAASLERHAANAVDRERKIELLLQAVRVTMEDLGAPDRALALADRLLTIDPENAAALELAARVRATQGDASRAVEAVEKLAEAERDPHKRADLFVRAGKLLEDAGDRDRAIARYKAALDADRQHPIAAAALRSIYAGRGDAHGAAEILLREIETTEGPAKKAALYAELGHLYRERLDDVPRANECFQQALELDATCTPAARGLGDVAFAAGDFVIAAKHYEPLLARTGEMTPEDAKAVSIRAGDAFLSCGNFPKAQRAFLNAKAFAPDDRAVLVRVADTTFEAGEADEAVELYRDVLSRFDKQLAGRERGMVLFRLGEALRRAGQSKEALGHLESAAVVMPDAPEPTRAIADLYASEGRHTDVVRTLAARIERATDDERFDLLVRTGDVYGEKLGDRAKATKAYVSALELRGDDRNLLTKLMGTYSEARDWARLVEIILRIAELVEDPKQLAKYYLTAASIANDELGRYDEAAEYYEQALENDASLDKAWAGLVRALDKKQDYDALSGAYLRQIERSATATDDAKAKLYDGLGEVFVRLNRVSEAVQALEAAQEIDAEDRERAEKLASIYDREPRRYAQRALALHRDLLRRSPYRHESYQALHRFYAQMQKVDEVWCLSQALHAMNMAEPSEEAFYKQHRSKSPAEAQEFLGEELWLEHVVHPDQDPLLTGIFALVTPAVVATRSKTLASLGVPDSASVAPDATPMGQTLAYAAGVIQLPLPTLYQRSEDAGGLSFVFTQPPAIGLGKGALAGGPAQALAFVAGRHLSYFKAGHYLRHLVPTGSGLRAWLLAALKLVQPAFPIPGDLAASVEEHRVALGQHLAPPELEKLRSLVHKLLAAAPELDMKRWVAAVDLTADRLGFVLANDLVVSLAVLRASPEDAAQVPSKDRQKELQLYAVSEEYLGLRQKLGVALAV